MPFNEKVGLGFVLDFRDQATREIREVRSQMRALRSESSRGATAFDSEVAAIEKGIQRAQKNVRLGRNLMIAGGAGLMASGLLTREAMKAEESWSDVLAVLVAQGESVENATKLVEEFERAVQDAGAHIPIQNAKMRESFYALASALGAVGAQNALEPTAKMAIAAKGSIESSTEFMTSALLTFGEVWSNLTPDERAMMIFDQTATAVGLYKTNLDALQEAMKNSNAMAINLGSTFAEQLAVIGTLQSKGLLRERAGTAVSMMMQRLAVMPEKLEEIKKKTKKNKLTLGNILGLEEVGTDNAMLKFANIRVTDQEGFMLPVMDIVKQFEKALGIDAKAAAAALQDERLLSGDPAKVMQKYGVRAADAAAITKLLEAEAARGFMLLLGASSKIEEDVARIQQGGLGDIMFEMAASSGQDELVMLGNQLEGLAVIIGDSLIPVIKDLSDFLKPVLEDLRDFFKENPGAAKAVGIGIPAVSLLTLLTGGALTGSNLLLLRKYLKQKTAALADDALKATDDVARKAASKYPSLAKSMAGDAAKVAGGRAGAGLGSKALGLLGKGLKFGGGAAAGVLLDPSEISAKESDYLRAMTEGPLSQEQYKNLGRMPTVEEYRQTLLANAPELLDFIYGGPGAEAPWTTRMQVPETYEGLVGQTTYISFGDISIDARGADGEEIYDTLMQKAADAKERGVDEKF